MQKLDAWRRKLATIQEWSGVERAFIPVVLTGLIYLQYFCWGLFVLSRDDSDRFTHSALLWPQAMVLLAIMVAAAALSLLGMRLRRTQPEAIWFQHLSANFYGVCLVWGGYLVGSLSLPAGIVLAGAPIMGFLILERRVMLVAITVAFLNILLFNLAAVGEWLPYAPLLRSPVDTGSALFWVSSHLFFAMPHLVVNTAICAVVLAQWRRREAQVLALSLTDVLTGVHNRRSILALLESEVARSRRHGPPLAVALLDLDHFKRINDSFGHPAGDTVLQAAARELGATLRQNDAIGRFGGEEFLLLLPQTTPAEAAVVLERCRARLAALALRSDQGQPIPVSASFGLVCNDAVPEVSGELLVHAADMALYQAKHSGRNRVVQGDVAALFAAGTAPLTHTLAGVIATGGEHGWWKRWRGWQQMAAGVLEWSLMARVALVLCLLLTMQVGVLVYALVVQWLPAAAAQVDTGFARGLAWAQLAQCALSLLLIGLVLKYRRRGVKVAWFDYLATQYFSLSMVAMGYGVGIFCMSSGAVLTVGPMVGFILFRRAPVVAAAVSALATIVALAYACALGWLPYAPLISVHGPAWQLMSPLWLTTTYLFFVPVMGIGVALADQIFGRWREREAQVRAMSLTDALTGVHNRRSVLGLLDREVARTFRLGPPLAVVILDLDHFKKINDTWGHPTGDRVLQQAARVIAGSLRGSDTVGRFGGEEFLLLLADTSMEGAVALAERCRAQLAATEVTADDGGAVPISASFGLVSNEGNFTVDGEALIKAADEALYRAKQGGRNRVVAVRVPTASASS